MSLRWRYCGPVLVLVAIHSATLFGGFLAPHSPTRQTRHLPSSPPSQLHFIDRHGRLHLRPFVYPLALTSPGSATYEEDQTRSCPLKLLARGDDYDLLGLFSTNIHLLGTDPPCKLHLLGTDALGRDFLARILIGGRISLFCGLLAATIALTLGLILGALAGYLGGTADEILMTGVELFLALPWLYLLLGLRAFLPLSLQPSTSFLLLVTTIGLIGWAKPARLFRGATLSERQRPFVQAAIAYGASHPTILRRHLAPHLIHLLRTQVTILVPTFTLAEVALSFLGLGISEPTPSWGTLLAQAQSYSVLANRPLLLLPALLLICTTLSYYALARSLRN